MARKKFVSALLIVTTVCLFAPEVQAKTACEKQAHQNYLSAVGDCAFSYGVSMAGCIPTILAPIAFAACGVVAHGMFLYCDHRATLTYRDTLEACDQESG